MGSGEHSPDGQGMGHPDQAKYQAVDCAQHRDHDEYQQNLSARRAEEEVGGIVHMGVPHGHDLLRPHQGGDPHKIQDVCQQDKQRGDDQRKGKVPLGIQLIFIAICKVFLYCKKLYHRYKDSNQ